MRRRLLLLALALVAPSIVAVPAARAIPANCEGGPDFNGDGFDDLAVGVPNEPLSFGGATPGAVNVIYGGPGGLSTVGDQFFHQDSPGIADVAEPSDTFGSVLASGDFDADGFADLAVGVPGQRVSGESLAGSVHIFYGSSGGLSASRDHVLHQDSSGMTDSATFRAFFGDSLAAGDLDADGRDDLVVGAPQKAVGGKDTAGSVHVIYGSSAGLTASGDQVFHRDSSGIADSAEAGDFFGSKLAACDFDGDGRADAAIGVPFDDVGAVGNAGSIHILYGSSAGLTASGDQVFHQDVAGIADAAESFDQLGSSVAAGDFDGDGRGDVVVGLTGQAVSGDSSAGAVHIIYGSSSGLTASGDQFFTQDSPGVADSAATFDNFGFSVTAGDFDGDGVDDVAVGVPFEDLQPLLDEGAVNVLYAPGTISASFDQFIHQDTPGIQDGAEQQDKLALTLSSGDFDGDGDDELVIGVEGEGIDGVEDVGAAHVIYASADGLTASGDQFFHQNTPGIADQNDGSQFFASGLVGSR